MQLHARARRGHTRALGAAKRLLDACGDEEVAPREIAAAVYQMVAVTAQAVRRRSAAWASRTRPSATSSTTSSSGRCRFSA